MVLVEYGVNFPYVIIGAFQHLMSITSLTLPRSNDTVRIRTFTAPNGQYTDRNTDRNFGHNNTARFVSVHGRKVAVLEVNTGRLRCRKTVPVITGLNGSFTAVKRPFYHGLHSENAV